MSSATAAHSASAIETVLNDQLGAILGPINDSAILWKIHDTVCKRIRAVEKATRGKPKKERDPNAPKKEAGPQLLAWNAQVARVEAVSAGSKKGKLTYNHARAVAGRLKEAGELDVKKDVNRIPSDEVILRAVETYYAEVNPASAATVKAGVDAKAKAKENPNKKEFKELKDVPEPQEETTVSKKSEMADKKSKAGAASNKPGAASNTPGPTKQELISMEPYDFIIDGKAYERIDINGYAFIWNEKGKYMGVYDEKKKTFDTSIADPTI